MLFPDADDGRVHRGRLGCFGKYAVDRKTLPISSSTTLTEPRSSPAMMGGPIACMRTDPETATGSCRVDRQNRQTGGMLAVVARQGKAVVEARGN